MDVNLKPKPINFKFGEYINKGLELLKKDFGNVFIAFLLCMVMSIIPFCGLLGMGNMYKYLQKLNRNQPANAGDIFDFKDFMPYFILQLIVFGGFFMIYIPFVIVLVITGAYSDSGNGAGPLAMMFLIPYVILMIVAVYYFVLKAFYMIPLISLKGIKDIKTAWKISKIMTSGNLIAIILFSFVIGILAQIGIIACGIGLFLTIPFVYTANYFAYEDALQQIEFDEITEIGTKNEF